MFEPINPYRRWLGSFLPNWLLERKELAPGAKILYARLMQFAGEDGHCWPSVESLVKKTGLCERMIYEYLNELTDCRLIQRKRRGLGQSNIYIFLRHPWMPSDGPREDAESTLREPAATELRETADKENQLRESGITHVIPGLASDQSLVSSKQADFKLDARSLPDDISEVIEAWEGQLSLPRVRTFAGKRAGSIRRALKDPFWREHWRDALSKLIKTPLLMGKGKISWRADLDWFLEPRNIEKLINGVYDDPNQKPPTRDYTRETI